MTPDTPTADGSRSASEAGPVDGSPGRVAELGLVSAGLGLVIYLIGFVTDIGGTSSPVLPLLLGGGLLAGAVALPTVGSRVLAPAAVLTTTGALLLLRAVVDDGGSALVVGALVLGLLEAGAAVGATLLQAGVLRSRPPRARSSSPPSALTGYAEGRQFPGQQYPGQPYPGAYGAPAAESYPGDQWTGEHAYGQNARYGGQYGVPGYPPPPPFATPAQDPAAYAAQSPSVPVGVDTTGDTAAPPRDPRPVTEPVADAAALGSGYRSAVVPDPGNPGTGAHRTVPEPGAEMFRSSTDAAVGTGAHRAVPALGTGAFRTGSRPAVPEATGSHRAVTGTGAYPPAAEAPPVSDTGSYRPGAAGRWPGEDGEHTHNLPAVSDEQQRP